MSQQTMGPLSILQQPTQHVPTCFRDAWPMLKASHQHYNPHTRIQQLSHQCHAPPYKVNTTCYCPSSKPSLPTMALLCHGLGASCGARCLHMLPFITAHRSNSSRETGQVPLKEPLGASQVRHEESWVCWENMKPSDWPNVAQAPSFLMPSLVTHNAHNTLWCVRANRTHLYPT